MTRLIKKYPNRRLYDTGVSRYITLADVRKLVIDEVPFQVIDTSNDEDLTRTILLQVIMEQECHDQPILSTEVLSKMIRVYGDTTQNLFTSYLDQSLTLFIEQQSQIQQQFKELFSDNRPATDPLTDLTQRNIELWRTMQEQFIAAAGLKQPSNKPKPKGDKGD